MMVVKTHVFSDVLGPHSLVGGVGRVEGPQQEPASTEQRVSHGYRQDQPGYHYQKRGVPAVHGRNLEFLARGDQGLEPERELARARRHHVQDVQRGGFAEQRWRAAADDRGVFVVGAHGALVLLAIVRDGLHDDAPEGVVGGHADRRDEAWSPMNGRMNASFTTTAAAFFRRYLTMGVSSYFLCPIAVCPFAGISLSNLGTRLTQVTRSLLLSSLSNNLACARQGGNEFFWGRLLSKKGSYCCCAAALVITRAPLRFT